LSGVGKSGPIDAPARSRDGGAEVSVDGPLVVAVFLNGEYTDPDFDRRLAARSDVLLAADGGAARLAALGLRPDAVIGDMDSLAADVAAGLAAADVPFVRHETRKDQTDGELAVRHALSRGAGRILLAGALGTQLDHVLGHTAILRRLAREGIEAFALSPHMWATAVHGPGELQLSGVRGCRFSFVALTSCTSVTLDGFDYGLDGARVEPDSCLGLGNTVVSATALVGLRSGEALLIVFADGLTVGAVRRATKTS